MTICLNQLFLALSDALGFVEMDLWGVTRNHAKRVAYISLKLAEYYPFDDKERFDLCSFAIMHDNGLINEIVMHKMHSIDHARLENCKQHCEIGENNVNGFPFMTNQRNIIKYHHEKYDGTGFYGLKGDKIPLMAQIIALADAVDNLFYSRNLSINNKKKVIRFVNNNNGKRFSPTLVEKFNNIAKNLAFWLDLRSSCLDGFILKKLPNYIVDKNDEEVIKISDVFSHFIDSNSHFTATHSKDLSKKVKIMAQFYAFDATKTKQLIIAANLHDLGKLAVSNSILDKNGALTENECTLMQSHTYYTRQVLSKIDGFEDITDWAANHHEKLDGSGYPYGINGDHLCFEARLMGCLDMYQALTEPRPYREKGLSHKQTMEI